MKKAAFSIGSTYDTPLGRAQLVFVQTYGSHGQTPRGEVNLRLVDGLGEATVPLHVFVSWMPDVPEHTQEEMKAALIELKNYNRAKTDAMAILRQMGYSRIMDVRPCDYAEVYDKAVARLAELKLPSKREELSKAWSRLWQGNAFKYFCRPEGMPRFPGEGFKNFNADQCKLMFAAIAEAEDRAKAAEKEHELSKKRQAFKAEWLQFIQLGVDISHEHGFSVDTISSEGIDQVREKMRAAIDQNNRQIDRFKRRWEDFVSVGAHPRNLSSRDFLTAALGFYPETGLAALTPIQRKQVDDAMKEQELTLYNNYRNDRAIFVERFGKPALQELCERIGVQYIQITTSKRPVSEMLQIMDAMKKHREAVEAKNSITVVVNMDTTNIDEHIRWALDNKTDVFECILDRCRQKLYEPTEAKPFHVYHGVVARLYVRVKEILNVPQKTSLGELSKHPRIRLATTLALQEIIEDLQK